MKMKSIMICIAILLLFVFIANPIYSAAAIGGGQVDLQPPPTEPPRPTPAPTPTTPREPDSFHVGDDFLDGSLKVNNGKVTLSAALGRGGDFVSRAGYMLNKYKAAITFVGGIATATFVLIFIVLFTKLGATATNPRDRQEVLKGMLISGVSASLMGSITLFVGLFYGLLK